MDSRRIAGVTEEALQRGIAEGARLDGRPWSQRIAKFSRAFCRYDNVTVLEGPALNRYCCVSTSHPCGNCIIATATFPRLGSDAIRIFISCKLDWSRDPASYGSRPRGLPVANVRFVEPDFGVAEPPALTVVVRLTPLHLGELNRFGATVAGGVRLVVVDLTV